MSVLLKESNSLGMRGTPLILLIGLSGTGKTTIAHMLHEKYGLNELWSYTTRPPRCKDETGHIFTTAEHFNKLAGIVAYTKYHEYEYAATKAQVDMADVYVIDAKGYKDLLKNYHTKRDILPILLIANEKVRKERMISRGDSEQAVFYRLAYDADEEKKIDSIFRTIGTSTIISLTTDNVDADEITDRIYNYYRDYYILLNLDDGW